MTLLNTEHETPEDQPVAEAPKKALVIVAVLSTVAGFIVEALQDQALGDAPGVMIICGWVLALATGVLRLRWSFLFGAAAMAGFVATALTDMILNGGHNLFPIEFAIYGIYALSAVVVAFVAGLLARLLFGAPKR